MQLLLKVKSFTFELTEIERETIEPTETELMSASLKYANLQIFNAIQKLQKLSKEERKTVYEDMSKFSQRMEHFAELCTRIKDRV